MIDMIMMSRIRSDRAREGRNRIEYTSMLINMLFSQKFVFKSFDYLDNIKTGCHKNNFGIEINSLQQVLHHIYKI